MSALVEIRGLSVSHARGALRVSALEELDLELGAGEVLALVGESGSGKSTLLAAIAQLFASPWSRIDAGSIRFEGRELVGLAARELEALRGPGLGLVFQDAQAALNPVLRVGEQVAEGLRRHGLDAAAARARALQALREAGLDDVQRVAAAFPHQLSGGMRQRALVALVLAQEPRLLLADEPTSALDPVLAGEILELLVRSVRGRERALLLVTHELGLALRHAQRVAVLYAGRIVELAEAGALAASPRHPYTAALLRADPARTPRGARFAAIPGAAPGALERGRGCAFAPRCALARELCRAQRPPLEAGSACFFAAEVRA